MFFRLLFRIQGISGQSEYSRYCSGSKYLSDNHLYHFRNKDGLILEIVKQTVHDQLESFRSVMEINVPFSEKIRMLMFNKAQAIADFHPDFAKWNESRNRQNVLNLFFPATWLHFVLAASSKTACLNLPHAATNSSLLPNRYIY